MIAERQLTRDEAAALLGVHRQTIARWGREGYLNVKLVPERICGRVRYTESQLRAFLAAVNQRRHGQASSPKKLSKTAKKQRKETEEWFRQRGIKIGGES